MDDEIPSCVVCNQIVQDPRYYIKHLKKHQEDGDKSEQLSKEILRISDKDFHWTFTCEYCTRKFTNPYNLKTHKLKSCEVMKRIKNEDKNKDELLKLISETSNMELLMEILNRLRVRLSQSDEPLTVGTGVEEQELPTPPLAIQPFGSEHFGNLTTFFRNREKIYLAIAENENFDDYQRLFVDTFSHLYCSPDHRPDTCNLYVTTVRQDSSFYVYRKDGWIRDGNIEDLFALYDILLKIILQYVTAVIESNKRATQVKNVIKTLNLNYHINRGRNNCWGRRIIRKFYTILYEHKDQIQAIWKQTSKKQKPRRNTYISLTRRPDSDELEPILDGLEGIE